MSLQQTRLIMIIEVAIFTALAIVLDNIPFLKFKIWANGGSVSLSMIPVFIVAFRWGLLGGLLSGFLFGILKLIFGPTVFEFRQALVDYTIAFTGLGLAGIFATKIKDAITNNKNVMVFGYITLGTLIGSLVRFLAHFYGGIVFFGHYAPEGQPVWLYSLLYNGSYMLPSFIICSIGIYLLFKANQRVLFR